MRYDDPQRPTSELGATPSALQTNGSPLPVITLMRPMLGDAAEAEGEGEDGYPRKDCWGWLCCIHAHRSHNRFGTYYGWLRDLGSFHREYLEDPENALLKYFKYSGPQWEPTTSAPRAAQSTDKDIFA
jgi:hypothetical protein